MPGTWQPRQVDSAINHRNERTPQYTTRVTADWKHTRRASQRLFPRRSPCMQWHRCCHRNRIRDCIRVYKSAGAAGKHRARQPLRTGPPPENRRTPRQRMARHRGFRRYAPRRPCSCPSQCLGSASSRVAEIALRARFSLLRRCRPPRSNKQRIEVVRAFRISRKTSFSHWQPACQPLDDGTYDATVYPQRSTIRRARRSACSVHDEICDFFGRRKALQQR